MKKDRFLDVFIVGLMTLSLITPTLQFVIIQNQRKLVASLEEPIDPVASSPFPFQDTFKIIVGNEFVINKKIDDLMAKLDALSVVVTATSTVKK